MIDETPEQQLQLVQPGWEVEDTDGEPVGEVDRVEGGYVVVGAGTVFTRELYVPASAIESASPDDMRVVLEASVGDVGELGWDRRPAEVRSEEELPEDRDVDDDGRPAGPARSPRRGADRVLAAASTGQPLGAAAAETVALEGAEGVTEAGADEAERRHGREPAGRYVRRGGAG